MKTGLKLLPLGIAAYCLFLVLTAPAAKLIPYFQSQLQPASLAGISGSLWSGKALQLNAPPVQLTDIHWRFRPLALLLGAVEFGVDGQLEGRPVRAVVGQSLFAGSYLSDVQGSATAADLMYWAGLRGVELAGQLEFALDDVEFSDTTVPAVAGQVVWKPAMVNQPLALNLGLAELTTTIESGGVTVGQLVASGGALGVQGNVSMQPDGRYQLLGDVKKTGAVPQAVDKFLATFAEFSNGSYRLEWSDQLN